MATKHTGLLAYARVQSKKHKSVAVDDIIAFFQQLSTLLVSGTPLLHAIRLCSEQNESIKLSNAIKDIANKVAGGSQFNTAAAAHPEIFETHWIQLIRTGEVSGQLGTLVLQLNNNIQKDRATRSKVTGALIYPFILLMVAFSSLFVMLWKVVPTFAEFFSDFGSELPAITQFVIDISDILRVRGMWIVIGMGVLSYFFRRFARTDNGRRQINTLLMATPILGEIFIQGSMEKFASTLSLLLRSGTPLLESLRTVQEVFKEDPIYYSTVLTIHNDVSRGTDLTLAMEKTGLFTNMMLSLVKTGEESGTLDKVLDQVATYYQGRLDTLISNFTAMLEPLIVVFMGVMVAGLLASIYLPMFQLAGGPG